MKIILDERETRLFHLVQEKCQELSFDISIEKKVLTLGDIHYENDEKEVLIIERKSLSDLIASIKDGRYEEQSYRLINSSGMYRSHIVYIIEGGLSQLINPTEKKMVYSAMNTLQFIKGFCVVKTTSINETAEWICFNAVKLEKLIAKNIYPWTPESQSGGEIANYCSVVKKTKKDNITPENIGEILLCQIPGISSVSAISIMKQFQSISNLIDCVKSDPNCLNNIICETKGKQRKLGKNVIQNIIKYLI